MLSYLKNRSQRVSIYSSFSTREEIIDRVPQESILGPLLFNISLKNIFYLEKRFFYLAKLMTMFFTPSAITQKKPKKSNKSYFKTFENYQNGSMKIARF